MKNLNKIIVLFLIGLLVISCKTQRNLSQKTGMESKSDIIFPKGDKITNANFTGTAYLQMLVSHDNDNPTAIGNVTFEPGARTKWHYHPAGQILMVTDGVGYYQEKGQVKKILRKGDIIKCPPNLPHWHGASPDSHFVQVAVTSNNKGAAVWLDAVTEEEYYN